MISCLLTLALPGPGPGPQLVLQLLADVAAGGAARQELGQPGGQAPHHNIAPAAAARCPQQGLAK